MCRFSRLDEDRCQSRIFILLDKYTILASIDKSELSIAKIKKKKRIGDVNRCHIAHIAIVTVGIENADHLDCQSIFNTLDSTFMVFDFMSC